MSNLFAINGATKRQRGTGLPVYDNMDHIFSKENKGFNDTLGLWDVPANRLPTFQIWLPYPSILSFRYRETRGQNDFTGVNFNVPVGGLVQVGTITADGVLYYVYQTVDDFIMGSPAPSSRWVGEIIANDGGTQIFYYTEEFTTFNCCP